MDNDAREKFQELLQMLQQQVLQSYFQGMQQAIQSMTPEDLARTREMVRDLNQMLEDRIQGREPRFNEFMDKYGDMFPGVQNLDQLLEQLAARMQAMASLMQSMSPEMRQQLQDMMDNLIGDDRLRADLMRLAANLSQLLPFQEMEGQRYPFSGDQPLSLMEAMAMMERMQGMNELEAQMQSAQSGQGIDAIDPEQVRDLVDEETAAQLERLQSITKMLEQAGYIRRKGDKWELTPRAMRKIGQKALQDVFSNLKRDGFGKHETEQRGAGGERTDETKRYAFGDPFLMDVKGTLMNVLARNGAGTPVRMAPDDFEVYRTELLTQSSTVLMLDKSRSILVVPVVKDHFETVCVGLGHGFKHVAGRIPASLLEPQLRRPQLMNVLDDFGKIEHDPAKAGVGQEQGAEQADYHRHRRRADGTPGARRAATRLQLPAHAALYCRDAARGGPRHAREHRDQHLHAGDISLAVQLCRSDDHYQQRPRLLRLARPPWRVHPGRLRPEQAQEDLLDVFVRVPGTGTRSG